MMRPSSRYLLYMSLLCVALAAAFRDATLRSRYDKENRAHRQELVRSLGITDLCLATEATYTRNPALADRFTPFQDHPGAFDHFPTGSVIPPPAHLVSHVPNR